MHELCYGAYRSERLGHNLNLVDGLLLEVSDFDRDAAREAGGCVRNWPYPLSRNGASPI
jgi:hypothetical protein